METWNAWRAENEGVLVNLSGADLRRADLTGLHHVLIGLVINRWINAFGRSGEPEFIPQPAMALRF